MTIILYRQAELRNHLAQKPIKPNKSLKTQSLVPACLTFKSVLSELMRKIKSLLAIPIVVGSMTLMVPPSQSQGVTDMVKVELPGKAIQKIEKEARKAAEKARKAAEKAKKAAERPRKIIGGCAGTREGCDPEKKIKKIFNKKMKKCVKAPCPVW